MSRDIWLTSVLWWGNDNNNNNNYNVDKCFFINLVIKQNETK